MLNPSEQSYELYLHAGRSADQNDNKESESTMTPSGDLNKKHFCNGQGHLLKIDSNDIVIPLRAKQVRS